MHFDFNMPFSIEKYIVREWVSTTCRMCAMLFSEGKQPMKKRLFSFLLVLTLVLGAFSAALPVSAASGVTEAQVIEKFAEAEAIWPDGEAYVDRLDDGCTLCYGFIREMFLYLFNAELPRMWTVAAAGFVEDAWYIENVTKIGHLDSGYSLEELEDLLTRALPGDVFIASRGWSNHGVIVRSADEDGAGVHVYDANWGTTASGEPILHTNRYWSADSLHSQWSSGVTLYRYVNYIETPGRSPENVQILQKVDHYTAGQFVDVSEGDWFAVSVGEAYEYGLMSGKEENVFDPDGNVSIAEAVTIASRIHSLYTRGENVPETSAGGAWYQMYLDYAFQNGIIGRDFYESSVVETATRAQFAQILAGALPKEALYEINRIPDDAIPDVKMDLAYAESVYTLYRAGIFGGSDDSGTFLPQTNISRAEAACVIARMADPANRISVNL